MADGCYLERMKWFGFVKYRHHSSSLVITRHHSTSLGITWHHSASLGITWHHSALELHARHHSASLGITRQHSSSLGNTRHHSASLGITRHHSASLGITQRMTRHIETYTIWWLIVLSAAALLFPHCCLKADAGPALLPLSCCCGCFLPLLPLLSLCCCCGCCCCWWWWLWRSSKHLMWCVADIIILNIVPSIFSTPTRPPKMNYILSISIPVSKELPIHSNSLRLNQIFPNNYVGLQIFFIRSHFPTK